MSMEDMIANSKKLFIFSTSRSYEDVQKLGEELGRKYDVPTGITVLILNIPFVAVRHEFTKHSLDHFIFLLKSHGLKEKEK